MSLILLDRSYNRDVLLLSCAGNSKDSEHRLRKYTDWLDREARHWSIPDLAEYRDYLLDDGLAASSVAAHLSTVRSRYNELVRTRDLFYGLFPPIEDNLDAVSQATLLTARTSAVNELIQRLRDAIHPSSAPVRIVREQDQADNKHIRLSAAQASRLMQAPGLGTLVGLRNTAIIATMLCTGIREEEATDLDVGDHKTAFGEELSLHVRDGKGGKSRLIPYGELDWCVILIDRWLEAAQIREGPIFRGTYPDGRLREERLTTRTIQNIVKAYPISISGQMRCVKPHDLRRSYARRMYDAGADPVAIQQNLGHASITTTMEYIGELNASRRRGRNIYNFDVGDL